MSSDGEETVSSLGSDDLYICSKCHKRYTKYSSYYSHLQTHLTKSLLKCKFCNNFSTNSKTKLYNHAYNNCHKPTPSLPVTFLPPPASSLPTPTFLLTENKKENVYQEDKSSSNKLSWNAW